MRLWPFKRRRALPAGAASALRAGEFPPNEWQIGADLEQWLPQRRAFSQTRRIRASSERGRGSFWVFLLVLIVVAALVYFVYLQPNGISLTMLWNNFLTAIQNLFAGVTNTDSEEETETASGVLKHTKHEPPALITSTPIPAAES